jgi:epoxyqueuosine reductase
MISELQDKMKEVGYKLKTVSIAHLTEIQEAVAKLIRQGLISEQLHRTWHFYSKTNESMPEAKTIIVLAMPQSLTRLKFRWHGRTYFGDISPTYFAKKDDSRAEEILKNVMGTAGYKILKAHLALKTLAVRSGLAKYGRNNISYIPRMGSFFQLVAFFSDCPCERDNWQEPRAMDTCGHCSLCQENCPTGSITIGSFLIHAEKCLGSLNKIKPDFPYWVQFQPDWYNALIGCMRCQFVCPVNKPYLQNVKAGSFFIEQETCLILDKTPWEELPLKIQKKLGELQRLYSILVPNLRALIEKQRKIT